MLPLMFIKMLLQYPKVSRTPTFNNFADNDVVVPL